MKQSFQEAWRDYRPLLCFGLLYVVLAVAQLFYVGMSVGGMLGWTWTAVRHTIGLACLFLMLVALGGFAQALCEAKFNLRETGRVFAGKVRGYLSGPMFAGACVGFLACFESLFFILQKATIRFVHPYAWDETFAAWDKALHFGRYPHEWMMDAFGGGMDVFLQLCYVGWFFFMYVGLGWALFCERERMRRLRFVTCYVLSWCLLGGWAATWLSSAGPVFYREVLPDAPDVYKELTDYISAQKEALPNIHWLIEHLLEWYHHKAPLVPNAPSAMPSLHAATSTLIVIYAWGVGRAAFVAALLAGLCIVVSSIYFGFHYAIDSYASAIAVAFMWWATGRWIAWRGKGAA